VTQHGKDMMARIAAAEMMDRTLEQVLSKIGLPHVSIGLK
jgi:N-methylhydantoinase B/oxoprolinase/acetone carboxylase alpha subunit